jgi:hypothetical protein
LDALVKQVPNLDGKMISLFLHSITTFAYIESVIVDIFINIYPVSKKFENDPDSKNSPQRIFDFIRKLFGATGTGFTPKYETDLSDD